MAWNRETLFSATLDPKLKERATVWAVRNGTTLTALVEEGLRLVMAKGGK